MLFRVKCVLDGATGKVWKPIALNSALSIKDLNKTRQFSSQQNDSDVDNNEETPLFRIHLDTLQKMNSLAQFYDHTGKHQLARPLLVDCLWKHEKVLGPNHPDTLTLMNYLAEFHERQGTYDKAESLYEECLLKRKTVLGLDHPDTFTSSINLAYFYESQGKHDLAEPLFQDSFQFINDLASVYEMNDDNYLADTLYCDILKRTQRALGYHHPDVLTATYNLAWFHEYQNTLSSMQIARSYYEKCLRMQKAKHGPADDPFTKKLEEHVEVTKMHSKPNFFQPRFENMSPYEYYLKHVLPSG